MDKENESKQASQGAAGENSSNSQTQDPTALIKAVEEMKKNYVSKEAFQQVQNENKALTDALINGQEIKAKEQEQPVSLKELRDKLVDPGINNLEFCTNFLKYRDECIKTKHVDPLKPSEQSPQAAADTKIFIDDISEAIKNAHGDPVVFNSELSKALGKNNF